MCTFQKACNSESREKLGVVLVVFGLTSASRDYSRGSFFDYPILLPEQEFLLASTLLGLFGLSD